MTFELLLTTYLRDDGGTPLGVGMPSGAPLRLDGERHYDGWLRLLRLDPCAYCGAVPGRTIDHVEPRSVRVHGLGGAHSWLNVVGACPRCNGAKAARSLLAFLLTRAEAADGRARRGRRDRVAA